MMPKSLSHEAGVQDANYAQGVPLEMQWHRMNGPKAKQRKTHKINLSERAFTIAVGGAIGVGPLVPMVTHLLDVASTPKAMAPQQKQVVCLRLASNPTKQGYVSKLARSQCGIKRGFGHVSRDPQKKETASWMSQFALSKFGGLPTKPTNKPTQPTNQATTPTQPPTQPTQ